MKNVGVGVIFFPFLWKLGAWRKDRSWVAQIGPIGFLVSGYANANHMKGEA
jgi:hypothetical protein